MVITPGSEEGRFPIFVTCSMPEGCLKGCATQMRHVVAATRDEAVLRKLNPFRLVLKKLNPLV